MKLTMMSFNLRVQNAKDGDNDWNVRFPQAAQAILAAEPAIVCTQEGTLAMLNQLQAQLPHYAWVGEGRMGGHVGEFCAVFYRRDLVQAGEIGHFSLSESPETMGSESWGTAYPRMCTWVHFTAESGKSWVVFNTHLDHVSSEARENGIRLILQRVAEKRNQGTPVVLAGDFNAFPDSPAARMPEEAGLCSVYRNLPGGAGAAGRTWHDFQGGTAGQPIDYLFVTPEFRVDAVTIDREKYEHKFPSDHYPITARMTL